MGGYELSPGGWELLGFGAIAIGAVLGVWLYFLPAFIADRRKHPDIGYLIAVNVCLGWTVFGWLAALLWAIVETSAIQEAPPLTTRADPKP